jgi:hypothetical protein
LPFSISAQPAQAASVAHILTVFKELQSESKFDAQRQVLDPQTFFPVVSISKEKMNEYLRNPPAGVSAIQWEQVWPA